MTPAFLIFHLNLAFSSIPEDQRQNVISRCYTPLLDLIETHGLPIGIELSGWTLRQISELIPEWVDRLHRLLVSGKCELIGSGYTQLIGPLAPYPVNYWNQRLGLDDYAKLLGAKPRLALVNEMAFASGLVDVYRDAGYEGIVMDRDNVRLALELQDQPYETIPGQALGPDGKTLPVLWTDSILFQKLQRFAHGEISLDDYLQYFHKRAHGAKRPLAVYCNDAEIFDFRPGRFSEEAPPSSESEWQRVAKLLQHLEQHEGVSWLLPSAALELSLAIDSQPGSLTSIKQPVPVKKQAKYNLARWAVSGRNDLWLNTCCHQKLKEVGTTTAPSAWRELCELWASDLRTHLTSERWQAICQRLENRSFSAVHRSKANEASLAAPPPGWEINSAADGILLHIKTPDLRLTLNQRKGLTIQQLAFRHHDFVPTVGTLAHGYFDSIEYGADFYTGGIIVELPSEHRRITDLQAVTPRFSESDDCLHISMRSATFAGIIEKTLSIPRHGEYIELTFAFPDWSRPRGSVRVGTTTLLPEAFTGDLELFCKNGGAIDEHFVLDRNCDHPHPSSSLVSSTTGLGATDGRLLLGDASRRLLLSWDPGQAAAFPMLIHQRIPPTHLTRIVFSLAEIDDTSRPEGAMPVFSYRITKA